jgi:hypothetical protein
VKLRALAIAILISLLTATSASLAYAKSCPDGLRMQQYNQQRKVLLDRAHLYQRAGAGLKYQDALAKVNLFTAKFPYIFLEQEIRNFPLMGNVPCLITAMRTASGQDLKWGTVSDGTIDLFLNGKKIREGISAADLLAIAKTLR